MQRLVVSGAVRPMYVSLGVKRLINKSRDTPRTSEFPTSRDDDDDDDDDDNYSITILNQ